MDKTERIKMIKAMEFIARQVNSEFVFEPWLIIGVADGDIEYGDLDVTPEDEENLECYIDSKDFADIMDTFLHMMKRACKDGGLYCDGIVSRGA